jgi:hypothetical protein
MKPLGQRKGARAVALWNRGDDSFSDIAAKLGAQISVDAVAEHLARQPGFPGYIGRGSLCRVCGVLIVGHGGYRYCSAACHREGRRRQWWEQTRKRRGQPRGDPPPRKFAKGEHLSCSDARIVREAKQEAKERGVTRDAVLAEWKFVPERSASSCVPSRTPSSRKPSSASSS